MFGLTQLKISIISRYSTFNSYINRLHKTKSSDSNMHLICKNNRLIRNTASPTTVNIKSTKLPSDLLLLSTDPLSILDSKPSAIGVGIENRNDSERIWLILLLNSCLPESKSAQT
jgi:hypothetical protein